MARAVYALALATTAVASTAPAQPALSSASAAVKFRRSVECGQSFRASLTFVNDGDEPWRSGEVALGAVDDSDPFTPEPRFPLPPGTEIAPGGSHSFVLELKAPDVPLAAAVSDWRLVSGRGAWFGAVASARVAVRCPARIDDAEVVSAVLPMHAACGRIYEGSVTVRNSGTTTWSGEQGYSLQEVAEGEAAFAPRRAALPDPAVAPGGEVSVRIAVRAPARGGSFPTQWRMSRRGAGGFGASVTQWVAVRCPAP